MTLRPTSTWRSSSGGESVGDYIQILNDLI